MMIWERLSQSKPYNKASRKQPPFKSYRNYRKIPKICPGAYIFQRPFLRGLFSEGLIFGGAYVRREICVSKSIGLACSGKEIYHFCFVLLCIRGQIPSTSPPGGLYSEGRFNGVFFALRFWGAYICWGLYMEGLIFGILRYFLASWIYSSSLFFKTLVSDLLTHGVSPCLLYVKLRSEYMKNFQWQHKLKKIYSVPKSRCVGTYLRKRSPAVWSSWVTTSCKQSLNLHILSGCLWEVQQIIKHTIRSIVSALR